MTTISFEEKPKRRLFGRKKKEINPFENPNIIQEEYNGEEDEIVILEKELELKKIQKEKEKLLKQIEEEKRKIEKEKEVVNSKDRLPVPSAIVPPEQQVVYPSINRFNLKRCPKCSKKLKRFKVKNFKTHISQVVVCKNKICDYHEELRFDV